jgi:hypothetical protein
MLNGGGDGTLIGDGMDANTHVCQAVGCGSIGVDQFDEKTNMLIIGEKCYGERSFT